jgi:hypothetical protein
MKDKEIFVWGSPTTGQFIAHPTMGQIQGSPLLVKRLESTEIHHCTWQTGSGSSSLAPGNKLDLLPDNIDQATLDFSLKKLDCDPRLLCSKLGY